MKSEMATRAADLAWSPDWRTLAILSAHVARVRFVDVDWALKHAAAPTGNWSWRQVDLSTKADLRMRRDLRFVGPLEIEVTVCSCGPQETQRTHQRRCTSQEIRKQFLIPLPIKTAHSAAAPSESAG